MTLQQRPVRNATTIGVAVCSHSGEFAFTVTDLHLPGRGIDLELSRSYRSSLTERRGVLGRGWTANFAESVERDGDDVVLHDASGADYRFVRAADGTYASPPGLYRVLVDEKKSVVVRQRSGRTSVFEAADRGGRLRELLDRNRNAIRFSYSPEQTSVVDTLNRKTIVTLKDGLAQEITDEAGRSWRYRYDDQDRMVEVIQPSTESYPKGTVIRYGYDDNHRLTSITDAKGQTYLANTFDDAGRVVAQKHGNGSFEMGYETLDVIDGGFNRCRTTCRRKNGSTLVLEHNELGNEITRTLMVGAVSLAVEDQAGIAGGAVPLVTTSVYNRDSELVAQTLPAGNTTEWLYSNDDPDPRNHGNLVQVTQSPAPGAGVAPASIVTTYAYDATTQRLVSKTDPRGSVTTHRYDDRGNRVGTAFAPVTIQPVSAEQPRPAPIAQMSETTYAYNVGGQLLRQIHLDGSITAYAYYPIDDPGGSAGSSPVDDPGQACGYLARVTGDATGAKVSNEYSYDQYGTLAKVFDGTGNAVQLQHNAMGRLEVMIGRAPAAYRVQYEYDENYNQIRSVQSFERLDYDAAAQTTTTKSAELSELREFDELDRVVGRTITGDDRSVTEHFIRDVAEQVVQVVRPSGSTTEYVYDERGLLTETAFGTGTPEGFTEHYLYTRNGLLRARVDGNGGTTTHHYDEFHRYAGFTDATGVRVTQSRDVAGNVIGVVVQDAIDVKRLRDHGRHPRVPLMETSYQFDEWNRVNRVVRAWHDSSGRALGKSNWDGTAGVVSTVLEYAADGRLGKIWAETGNTVSIEHDALGRIVTIGDETGESCSIDYDVNDSPTAITYRHLDGPAHTVRRRYDEMGRVVEQQVNDDTPERFEYNALGAIVTHVTRSGLEVHHAHDGFGRLTADVINITGGADGAEAQQIARQFEYDDNFALSAYVDAAGNRTTYRRDSLGRQIGITYADGSTAAVEYDAAGNVGRLVDQNSTETICDFDAANRLVRRQTRTTDAAEPSVEQYQYDGADRLVAATTATGVVRRSFDSLSRMLSEDQAGRAGHAVHDAAGNVTSLAYPGGEVLTRRFDGRNRVTAVETASGTAIARAEYGSGDLLSSLVLSDVVAATYAYNDQDRLESVEYRRVDNGDLVEGFQYAYDATGRLRHELCLDKGKSLGERYKFDTAGRPINAQYGVADVLDDNSAFEYETTCWHLPERAWARRLDVDGRGRTIDDQAGAVDQRNRYRTLGDRSFTYDAAGNCIRADRPSTGFWLYTYDADNRLIEAQCFDTTGRLVLTIDYTYDALGRQVRKVVTDAAGATTVYEYVWAGSILIEEYENGQLVRTYLYGIGSRPARLSVKGAADYVFIHNGRGLASGLVPSIDPNAFAEKYGYEVTGSAFMSEVDGVSVDLPSRDSTRSGLLNSILGGGLSGSPLRDWDLGTLAGLGGRQMNPAIAEVLNSVGGLTGQGHKDARAQFADQLNGYISMLGQAAGSGANGGDGPTMPGQGSGSKPPDTPYKNDPSLYGMHDGKLDEDDDPPSDAPKADPAPSLVPKDPGSTPGAGATGGLGGSGTPANDPPDPSKNAGNDAINRVVADHPVAAAVVGLVIQAVRLSTGGVPKGMSDPDADPSGGKGTPPSASEIEARLNRVKHPVNPNGGLDDPGQIDTTSPPPSHSGADPTVALYDPDFVGITGTGDGTPRISTAPIDYMPGYGPATGGTQPTTGGNVGGDTDRHFP